MAAWLSRLVAAGVIIATARPAFADGPSFAELLARAEAQAAAGHRWEPPGDNMTESVSAMMELISSATPEQLAALSDLLEKDAKRLPHPAAGSEAVSEPTQPTAAATAELDEAVPPAVRAATSEPDRPGEPPAAPARRFELDRPGERQPVWAAAPEPDRRVERPTAPAARFELDRPAERPAMSAARSEPERPVERQAAPATTLEPERPVPAATSEPGRPARSAERPEPDLAAARPVVPATTSEPDRRAARPGAQAMAAEPERAIIKPAAPVARRPSPRAADLLARGQEAERLGDVSGARRFYASAVQQGSATAALDLGRLYDPVYLKRTALGGIDADLALARHWYEQAIAMGDAEAGHLLDALALR